MLNDLEVNIGGLKLKGIWIAVAISVSSSIAGIIWGASELMYRISTIESNVEDVQASVPNIKPLEEKVAIIEEKINANNITGLQGKLAELDSLLNNIKERQVESITSSKELQDKINEMQKEWLIIKSEYVQMGKSLKQAETATKKFKAELDDLWKGLDAVSSPLG